MDAALNLEGRAVIVTGACGGVGAAVCSRTLDTGARVIALDEHPTTMNELLRKRLLDAGGEIHELDVSDSAAWRALSAGLVSVDALVTCAAVIHPEDGANGTVSGVAWERTIAVNLTGVWLACQTAIGLMRAGGRGGSIVNIGSIVANLGSASAQPAYTSSKGAVLALSRELAVAHAAEGIRVNVISPGLLATQLTHDLVEEERELHRRLTHIPLGRLGVPADIAGAVAWLLSDDAGYVTGADLPVDGGLTAAFITGREQSR